MQPATKPLSVLDLSFVTTQTPPSRALHRSVEMAQAVERLGYARYWLAEHHSMPSIASSAPDIMIGRVAAATNTIRVGSGGIMLTNHAPLVIAERFKTLEALFPGRIDLGMGRAPGTDQMTAYALRRRLDERQGDDFLERLQELMAWESRAFPEGHPFSKIQAMPSDAPLPPVWLLGSSDYSAYLSGRMGVGYAFASHFSDHDAVEPMLAYRTAFEPVGALAQPYSIIAVAAVIAESDEEAQRLSLTYDLNWLRRARGVMMPLPSPEEAAAHPWTEQERAYVAQRRKRLFAGSPQTVVAQLKAFADATKADEIMVTSSIFDFDARVRSYELLMEEWRAG
ncbi:MAG: LLM class flavin-dependent oxidoreductase [Beijerinckiaceae bacterium]|nr:LLM class flavin-dependent oxidoreductase [Beijerinckiaceae bacterium]